MLFSEDLSQKQKTITEFFELSLLQGKISNAYLLLGSNIQDKLSLAQELNMLLNCDGNQNSFSQACGTCINCKWISSETHPMTPLYLAPAEDSKKQSIKIEQVKELRKELNKSSEYFRIVLIPDASYQVLSKDPANALLKILEEPNSNTLFLLCATESNLVLPTIKSRTQELSLTNSLQEDEEEFEAELQTLISEIEDEIERHQSKLDMILNSEKISEKDNHKILNAIEILQEQYSKKLDKPMQDPSKSKPNVIFALEQAKTDLKSFVRPKTALEQMFRRIHNYY